MRARGQGACPLATKRGKRCPSRSPRTPPMPREALLGPVGPLVQQEEVGPRPQQAHQGPEVSLILPYKLHVQINVHSWVVLTTYCPTGTIPT